jgi:hypothetical protein
LADEARPGQAQEPGADVSPSLTMGLDVFHTQREVERVLHRQWKQVERQTDLPPRFEQATPYNTLVSLRLGSSKRGGVSAYILHQLLAVGKGVPNALRIAS